MSVITFKTLKPVTVLAISEAIGTISFALGAACVVGGIFSTLSLLLFGLVAIGAGLATLLGVILVRTVIQVAESNARIVLELETL